MNENFPELFFSVSPWNFHPAQSHRTRKKLFLRCNKNDEDFWRAIWWLMKIIEGNLVSHEMRLRKLWVLKAWNYPWQWNFSSLFSVCLCVWVREVGKDFSQKQAYPPWNFSFQREKKINFSRWWQSAMTLHHNWKRGSRFVNESRRWSLRRFLFLLPPNIKKNTHQAQLFLSTLQWSKTLIKKYRPRHAHIFP